MASVGAAQLVLLPLQVPLAPLPDVDAWRKLRSRDSARGRHSRVATSGRNFARQLPRCDCAPWQADESVMTVGASSVGASGAPYIVMARRASHVHVTALIIMVPSGSAQRSNCSAAGSAIFKTRPRGEQKRNTRETCHVKAVRSLPVRSLDRELARAHLEAPTPTPRQGPMTHASVTCTGTPGGGRGGRARAGDL